MHPAFSVIFLTTLIGAGQGLFLALYTAQVFSLFRLLPAQHPVTFYALGSLVALLLLVAGLAGSFLHLGRPERAWRSAAMWRTSWLSREVIALPACMAAVAAWGLVHYMGWNPPLFTIGGAYEADLALAVGAIGTVLCLALFVCTGMIYACIRFLQEWATPLTVVNYILFGGASGFMLATAFAAWQGTGLVDFYGIWAIIMTAMAFVTRSASLVRNARLKHKSTMQSAIGVRHARIQQKAQGAMAGSFNTREFFHGASPRKYRFIKWVFLVLVFPLPLLLVSWGLSTQAAGLLIAAFLVQYVGLLAERWFFFAQANHPQNLYYQTV
ncbi:MAG TPA: DmsC/YnfH family molybdoenzyme membrane anchor subunit [Xanthomonadales bacterium]|jgi:DMSO reductase anchor subunit|nr:DmsC/YnfH family molybdoenzyme membrane anchor subunit [Xanthomonadales bacterium]